MTCDVLASGSIVYHGPSEGVLDFFESQGFVCPPDTGVAEFLQEVTSRKDQQVGPGHRTVAACMADLESWRLCVSH